MIALCQDNLHPRQFFIHYTNTFQMQSHCWSIYNLDWYIFAFNCQPIINGFPWELRKNWETIPPHSPMESFGRACSSMVEPATIVCGPIRPEAFDSRLDEIFHIALQLSLRILHLKSKISLIKFEKKN